MASLPPVWWKHKGLSAFAAAVLVVLGVGAVSGSRGLAQYWQLQDQLRDLEAEAMQLQQVNEALRTHVRRLQSDAAYQERVVRGRLGWVKDGELVYRVTRPR